MSAYALSSFLPPATSSLVEAKEQQQLSSSTKSTTDDDILSLGRCHEVRLSVPEGSTNIESSSSSETKIHCSASKIHHNVNRACRNLYDITVKSVFIDPITFLTSTKNEYEAENDSSLNPNDDQGSFNSLSVYSIPSFLSSSSSGYTKSFVPSWSAALHFTLTIGTLSNGRRYNVKRDLASLIEFRDNLLEEQYEENQRKPEEKEEEQSNVIEIPQLPIDSVINHIDCQSLARSFSRLQGGIKSYSPQIEMWLRSVAIVVPSSKILSQFLYEPGKEKKTKSSSSSSSAMERTAGNSSRRRNNTKSTLDTIIEDAFANKNDDEDDCDDF